MNHSKQIESNIYVEVLNWVTIGPNLFWTISTSWSSAARRSSVRNTCKGQTQWRMKRRERLTERPTSWKCQHGRARRQFNPEMSSTQQDFRDWSALRCCGLICCECHIEVKGHAHMCAGLGIPRTHHERLSTHCCLELRLFQVSWRFSGSDGEDICLPVTIRGLDDWKPSECFSTIRATIQSWDAPYNFLKGWVWVADYPGCTPPSPHDCWDKLQQPWLPPTALKAGVRGCPSNPPRWVPVYCRKQSTLIVLLRGSKGDRVNTSECWCPGSFEPDSEQ